jgi:hypothetical protein
MISGVEHGTATPPSCNYCSARRIVVNFANIDPDKPHARPADRALSKVLVDAATTT